MARPTVERPAFMLYAANIMAKREYRNTSLSGRGLWISISMECWVNQEVPADPIVLASYIGQDPSVVAKLLPEIMWAFEVRGNDIFSPSLEKYRDEQDARHAKQSAGGKNGAKTTNSKHKSGNKQEASNPQVTCVSLDKTRSDQIKTNQPLERGVVDPFVAAYENASKGH